MKVRHWWVALAVVVVVVVAAGAAVVVSLVRSRHQWTTSSPEALTEFQEGMDASMKLYHREAVEHFQRAVKLDPGFVMARIRLAQSQTNGSKQEAVEKLRALLASVNLARLTPRERFLIKYLRARVDDQGESAEKLLDGYLGRYPRDPYALSIKANILWRTGHLAEARAAYERLVKISPNWVVGYNNLGYIAMEQGDFAKSEQNFATYKFIAPDQANPLDSLGELYLLTGRYEEAIREFRGALGIKRDFCASWDHLATAYLLLGDVDSARKLVQQMQVGDSCKKSWGLSLRCTIELYPDAMTHQWRDVLKRADETGCSLDYGLETYTLILYRAGAMAGERTLCQKIENSWRQLAEGRESGESSAIAKVLLRHAAGVQAVADGDYASAQKAFQEVDGKLQLRGSGEGLFKLLNLACLAEVEGAAGDRPAEKRTVAKIRRVNPAMASAYESGKFRLFGLKGTPGK